MSTLSTLVVKMGFDGKGFDKGLDKAESRLKKTSKTFKKAGLGMTAAFTLPAMAGAKKLLDIGTDFDAMSDKIAIGTGATGDALKSLEDTALNVFKSIPTTMDDTGTAVTMLNQKLGLTGDALESLTTTELELARITGEDLASVIGSTTDVFNNWGVAVEDQVAILDKLYRAFQASGVPVDTLSQQLTQFGPVLRQMGFNIDESIALLASLGKAGLDTGVVMSGFRFALKKFTDEGLTDTKAALLDVFTQIKNAPTDLAASQIAFDTFGAKAGPLLANAIRTGQLSYEDMLAVIESGDTTILDSAKNANDLSEKWQIFKNNLTVAVLPAATKLFDLLNDKGIPTLTTLIAQTETLNMNVQALPPGIQKMIIVLAAFFAIAGPLALAIGFIVSNLVNLGAALGVIIAPITAAMGTFLVALPTLLIVGPILLALKTNVLGLGDAFHALADKLQSVDLGAIGTKLFSGLWTAISNYWTGTLAPWLTALPQAIVDALAGLNVDTLSQLGVDLFMGLWNGILTEWGLLSAWILTVPELVVGAIGDVTTTLTSQGEDLITGFWAGIQDIWFGLKDWLGTVPNTIVAAVGDLSGVLYWAGRAVMNGFYDGLMWGWYNVIEPTLRWISDQIAKVKGPPARDAKMLVNAGELIMGGLGVGLDRGWQDVSRQLSSYTPRIAGGTSVAATASTPRLAAMPAVSGSSGRGDIHLTVKVDGNVYGIDDLTMAVTKEMMPALTETYRDVRRARGMAT